MCNVYCLMQPTLTRPKGPKSRKPPSRPRLSGTLPKQDTKSSPSKEHQSSLPKAVNHQSPTKDSHTSPIKDSLTSPIKDRHTSLINHATPKKGSQVYPKSDSHAPTLPLKSSPPLPISPRSSKARRSLRSSRSSVTDRAYADSQDSKEVCMQLITVLTNGCGQLYITVMSVQMSEEVNMFIPYME